jgi:hypothetical protein
VEELGHGAVGFSDDAQADFASVFDRQDHVHAAHCGDFFEKLAFGSGRKSTNTLVPCEETCKS